MNNLRQFNNNLLAFHVLSDELNVHIVLLKSLQQSHSFQTQS